MGPNVIQMVIGCTGRSGKLEPHNVSSTLGYHLFTHRIQHGRRKSRSHNCEGYFREAGGAAIFEFIEHKKYLDVVVQSVRFRV